MLKNLVFLCYFQRAVLDSLSLILWPVHGLCVWASLCHNWFYDYSISLLKLSDVLGGNCLKVNLCVLMN